jgi:signal transduction histidine kinase
VSTAALARTVVEAARVSPGRLRSWLRRPLAIDLGLVVVVGIIAVFGTAEASQDGNPNGTRPLDWLGWGLLLAATLALGVRRRWPALVLLTTCAAIALSVALGYPTGPIWGLPLIALYSAASIGRRRLALLAAAAMIGLLLAWALLSSDPGTPGEIGFSLLLVALGVAVGEVARGRRDYLAEVERRALEAERTREEAARRHANEERMRLARDLHDITAHTIAVIAIQAGVAEDALDRLEGCPEPVREAVRAIRGSSRQAMAELKATVTALRDGEAPRDALPGLWQLDELIGMAASAGVRVELEVRGDARPLPPAVDLTAFRIVQESLTNVLRHARAERATVRVRYGPDALRLEVDDDGAGSEPPGVGRSTGHGLAVMAERASAVGGRLEAGPGPARGFRVDAWLPLDGAAP